jgi:NAD(P)H dehydrogenase (quinone)
VIAITGAAGQTGVALLRRLQLGAVHVRAMVSREASVERVRSAGATEVSIGDLRSQTDVRRALQGARVVYHICPVMSDDELGVGRNVIAAACAEGADRIVFHSLVHAQSDALLHHRDKRHVEQELIESGLAYTLLKPTMYMQNMLWEWEAISQRGVYRLPYSEHARMSLVDVEDVAEAAAVVLTGDGWAGGEFELCSGDNLTRVQMAAVLSEVLGRPVRAESYPIDEWRPIGARTRTPFQVDRVGAMFGHYDRHGLAGGNPRVLQMILGRRPTSYLEFVRRAAGQRQGQGIAA